jgi:hypothetical protein
MWRCSGAFGQQTAELKPTALQVDASIAYSKKKVEASNSSSLVYGQ